MIISGRSFVFYFSECDSSSERSESSATVSDASDSTSGSFVSARLGSRSSSKRIFKKGTFEQLETLEPGFGNLSSKKQAFRQAFLLKI
jgi:hypothetical protein